MLNIKTVNIDKHLLCNGEEVLEVFSTNAKAWRALDRLQYEPVNKQEQTSQWLEKLFLND